MDAAASKHAKQLKELTDARDSIAKEKERLKLQLATTTEHNAGLSANLKGARERLDTLEKRMAEVQTEASMTRSAAEDASKMRKEEVRRLEEQRGSCRLLPLRCSSV